MSHKINSSFYKKIVASIVCFFLFVGQSHALFEFSISDEVELGKAFDILVKSQLPIVEDPEIKGYVDDLLLILLEVIPPQPFQYEVNVILSPVLNAFASPGGFLFLYSGLLQNLSHEAELMSILAHEVAHVSQRHIAQNAERGGLITIASLLVAVAGAIFAEGDAAMAIFAGSTAAIQTSLLSYSRTNEADADEFGLRYLLSAGYNPYGFVSAFRTLNIQSFGLGSEIPSYLSTHPNLVSRIAGMNTRISSMSDEIQNRPYDDTRFLRVQTLLTARYGNSGAVQSYFINQKEGQDLAIFYMGNGIVAERQNDFKKSEEFFDKALELKPNDPLILREYGVSLYNKGNPDIAQTYLEKAISIDSDDYMAIFYLARILDEKGLWEEAQRQYRNVLIYVPENASVLDFYGRSLGRSGQEFEGYLYLALSSLYLNDSKKTLAWLAKAEPLAKTEGQEASLRSVKREMEERMKILEGY